MTKVLVDIPTYNVPHRLDILLHSMSMITDSRNESLQQKNK